MLKLCRSIPKKSEYSYSVMIIRANKFSTTNEAVTVVEKPAYPEILPVGKFDVYKRKKQEYFEKFKKIPNVEEKLVAMNLPRYYGWPSYYLNENIVPYDYLPFTQYVTRTIISENDKLPVYFYNDKKVALLDQIKTELEKVLIFEHYGKKYKYEVQRKFEEFPVEFSEKEISDIKSHNIINQINSAIIRVLAPEYPHLFSAMVDYKPRIEAFWRVGGFYYNYEDYELRKRHFSKPWNEELLNEPTIDRYFQYFGTPVLQLRNKIPLRILPEVQIPKPDIDEYSDGDINKSENTQILLPDKGTSAENTQIVGASAEDHDLVEYESESSNKFYPLNEYKYDPSIYFDFPRERIHGAIVPGFWPDDPHRFGLLSYHSRNHMLERPGFWGEDEAKEALHAQAILASFSWLLGQALYQGFVPYHNLTYPFTTQTVITDGKIFSFYQYQLHTTALHSDNWQPGNPLHNECYATPPQELFASVDNDRVTGWNDDTLLNLISMYTNVPAERGYDLTPYLDKKEKYVANIEDDKRRTFVHEAHRFMTSHRPRHRALPEIWNWEQIYKIDNKRRILDARKRFFEKFEDPLNEKTFDDHPGRYIPKMGKRRLRAVVKRESKFYPDLHQGFNDVV